MAEKPSPRSPARPPGADTARPIWLPPPTTPHPPQNGDNQRSCGVLVVQAASDVATRKGRRRETDIFLIAPMSCEPSAAIIVAWSYFNVPPLHSFFFFSMFNYQGDKNAETFCVEIPPTPQYKAYTRSLLRFPAPNEPQMKQTPALACVMGWGEGWGV